MQNSKRYNLEEQTLKFAKEMIEFVKTPPRTVANMPNNRKDKISFGICLGFNRKKASWLLVKHHCESAS